LAWSMLSLEHSSTIVPMSMAKCSLYSVCHFWIVSTPCDKIAWASTWDWDWIDCEFRIEIIIVWMTGEWKGPHQLLLTSWCRACRNCGAPNTEQQREETSAQLTLRSVMVVLLSRCFGRKGENDDTDRCPGAWWKDGNGNWPMPIECAKSGTFSKNRNSAHDLSGFVRNHSPSQGASPV
jgi:hypothetical protein